MIVDTNLYAKLTKSLLDNLFEQQDFPLYMSLVKHPNKEVYGAQILRYSISNIDRLLDTHVLDIVKTDKNRSIGSKMPYFKPISMLRIET